MAGPESVPGSEARSSPLWAAPGGTGQLFGNIRIDAAAPVLVQPKLKLGVPGDELEQEADAIADQIVDATATAARTVDAVDDHPSENVSDQRRNANLAPVIAHQLSDGAGTPVEPRFLDEILHAPGAALDPDTRAFM